MVNLIYDPEYADVLARMKMLLQDKRRKYEEAAL